MKEVKDKQLKFRVSANEKETIEKYAEEHGMTVSELLRAALNRYIAIDEKKEEEK